MPSQPFSDSSSLARHRRIHSGKRPYKCPFMDCQKTFTRYVPRQNVTCRSLLTKMSYSRTTLTRHQSHHTGTIQENAEATAAVLAASRPSTARASRSTPLQSPSIPTPSTYDSFSSSNSTPSPLPRPDSLSPGSELTGNYRQPGAGYMYASIPAAVTSHPLAMMRPEMAQMGVVPQMSQAPSPSATEEALVRQHLASQQANVRHMMSDDFWPRS